MNFTRISARGGSFVRSVLSVGLLVACVAAAQGGDKTFKEPVCVVVPKRHSFEVTLESAQMFNYDGNPNKYYFMTQMLSLAWEPFRPLKVGPITVRSQIMSTVFASAILRGPETFYLGWGPQLRFIFPIGDTPWSLYGGGGGGFGYANADPNAKDDHGLGQQFTFIILGGGGVRYAVTEQLSLSCGILWHHLSNADMSEPRKRNIGPDELGVVAGVSWAF